jgi:hypothetical protein
MLRDGEREERTYLRSDIHRPTALASAQKWIATVELVVSTLIVSVFVALLFSATPVANLQEPR